MGMISKFGRHRFRILSLLIAVLAAVGALGLPSEVRAQDAFVEAERANISSRHAPYSGSKEPVARSGSLASDNVWNNRYVNAGYWSRPISSFLKTLPDGGFERCEYRAGDGFFVETYDEDLHLLKAVQIPRASYTPTEVKGESFFWGSAYQGSRYNYILTGQSNVVGSNDVPVLRLTQYDLDWRYLDNVEILGANTRRPFDAGNARFAESGNVLNLRTCHEMYTSDDGLNHQANMIFDFDQDSLAVTDGNYLVAYTRYNYVSHSFNQFVQCLDGRFYGLDHGDAYPRAVVICDYDGDDANVYPISGKTGDNRTGVEVGGFTGSPTTGNLLAIGTSIDQRNFEGSKTRNVWLTVTDADDLSSSRTIWLTNTPEGGESAFGPRITRISGDRFLVMWGIDGGASMDAIRYAFVDGQGRMIGEVRKGRAQLSDCEPVLADGKVTWYVTGQGQGESKPIFYRIDAELGTLGSAAEPVPVFRLYNRISGEHLFTIDAVERDALCATALGWTYEGEAWNAPAASLSPVYRLYNRYTGEHLYTVDGNEYWVLSSGGWQGGGVKFYSAEASGKPVYRLMNPYGTGVDSHHYTIDGNERSVLLSGAWKDEGVGWRALL